MALQAHRRVARLADQVSLAPGPCAGGGLLKGVKVLELATVVAGPGCCAVLADFGADVLKIERPEDPDNTRSWAKGDDPARTADPLRTDTGSHFTQLNRGKRAIALNYSTQEGLCVLKRLLADADIFVTNVRNKSLKKQGLDYESLSKEFPKLIYGHLSAWGLEGPMKDDPGYDMGAFWAYTGLMELHRSSDDASMPRFPWSFGDNTTSMQLVAGIAFALLHREKTGEGQLVDAALLRSGIWALSHPISLYAGGFHEVTGQKNHGIRNTQELGQRAGTITMSRFLCKDDRWVQLLGMETGRHWDNTLRALGLQNTIELSRDTNWVAAMAAVDAVMAQKPYDEWHTIFMKEGVWHCPVHGFEEMLDDPQANAAGAFAEVPGLRHKLVKAPFKLSSQVGCDGPKGPAPGFGEHTTWVLESLGYSDKDITQLREAKIVK